jgi:outer membrane receptor protein involved in Fe transport
LHGSWEATRANPASYAVRQFQDSPGGEIKGYELSYQQDFTFLPSFWKNFGVQANYTHLQSELQYIVDPVTRC